MFAVISNSNLLRGAHALARKIRNQYATYRDALSAALKEGWRCVRKMQQIVKGHIAAAAKAAFATVKVASNITDPVARKLIDLGCKVWKGRRIYAGWQAQFIFDNFSDFGRGRRAKLTSAYYDLTDRSWHDNWIGKINAAFAA